jgi:hypothetical protein
MRMASKTATQKAPRKKASTTTPRMHSAKTGPPPIDDVPASADDTGARALIRAGLKALGEVGGDMRARQARIFELLLGIGQSPIWHAKARLPQAPDPFGKFEAVFDQRVASSLQRLGMPSPQELKELSDQVKLLTELLQQLQPKPRRR